MACTCFVWLGALPPVLSSWCPRVAVALSTLCENPALWTVGARPRLHGRKGKRGLRAGPPFPWVCADHFCSVGSRVKLTGALLNSSTGPSTMVSIPPC